MAIKCGLGRSWKPKVKPNLVLHGTYDFNRQVYWIAWQKWICKRYIVSDISKAFDTVVHKILLQKPYHYRIKVPAYGWICSYFTDQKQYVTYCGISSNTKNVMCGVPQGSILGPILFLFISIIVALCVNINTPISLAIDTNLFCSRKDFKTIEMEITTESTKISTWLKVIKLCLNI